MENGGWTTGGWLTVLGMTLAYGIGVFILGSYVGWWRWDWLGLAIMALGIALPILLVPYAAWYLRRYKRKHPGS